MSDVVKYLGDKTPSELGMQVLRQSQRPILSATVDNVVTVPEMHGAYDFGAYMGPKSFNLECAFMTRDATELQSKVGALAAYLLDGDGRPRTMPIVFANQPDRQYAVRYSGDLQIDRIAGLGTFTLPFTAYDPFAYSAESTSDILTWDTDYTWDDDFAWDDDYSYSITAPSTLEINNIGNQNALPIIKISGAFSSLSLTVGGVVFTYNAPLNGVLELDFKRRTAKVGTTNVLQNSNAQFGKLPPGISNVVVGGTGLNITIDIIFNFKYAA